MRRNAAILTGDLIGSTRADPAATDRAMAILKAAAVAVSGWEHAADTHFTRFRGDGWQTLVDPAKYAPRAALFFKANLGSADTGLGTRIAIGLGEISDPGPDGLGAAHGAGFEASGRALDAMRRTDAMTIAGARISGLHHSLVTLLAARTRRWSREQAEAMAYALDPASPTLAEIAAKIGITQQAVNYRLKAAGYTEIDETLRTWEKDMDAATGTDR